MGGHGLNGSMSVKVNGPNESFKVHGPKIQRAQTERSFDDKLDGLFV